MPTHFDITSIARRLDAGTYVPRTQNNLEIPAINNRPAREFVTEVIWPAASCIAVALACFIAACFLTNQWR